MMNLESSAFSQNGLIPSKYMCDRDQILLRAIPGKNDFAKLGYGGTSPPSGTHRYFFKRYALDQELALLLADRQTQLLKATEVQNLATTEVTKPYSRQRSLSSKHLQLFSALWEYWIQCDRSIRHKHLLINID